MDLRTAQPPRHLRPFGRWLWQLTKDVVDEYRKDGIGDLAASITFWTLLSVPALVLVIVSALGSLEAFVGTALADDVEREVITFMEETFRDDASALTDAVRELFDTTSSGVLTLAALAAVYSLSRGFSGVIRALDVVYDVEDGRSWWHVRIVAIGFGIGTVVMLAGSTLALELFPRLVGGPVVSFLTGPAIVVVMFLWLVALYHVGPNHRTPWRYDLVGAGFTAVGWVVLTRAYSFYVALADQGNRVQTTIGAVLLALTLVHLLSVVMLVGAQLNAVLAQRAGVVDERPSIRRRAETLLTDLRS